MTEEIDAAAASFSASAVDLTDVAVPQTITRARIQWPGGPSVRQTFSLPESIIYYIAKSPSSAKVYLKMAQSCKFFFEKNPIIVAASIHGESKLCSKTRKECKNNNGKCCIDFDIKRFSSKIWLTKELFLSEIIASNYPSMLCSKIYQSEIYALQLHDKTLFLDDFKFLASSVMNLGMLNFKITDNDGNIVSIDEILECVPKLTYFSFYFNNDKSSSTFKNIAKLNDLVHLKYLFLINIPEIYNVEDLSNFIKAHKNMKIGFSFNGGLSQDYKNQLDVLIDAIIESRAVDQIIKYDGQDEDKLQIVATHWLTWRDLFDISPMGPRDQNAFYLY